MTAQQDHELRFQLSASAVDAKRGVITGATVAKSGVPAIGKFVFIDANGKQTRDPEAAQKRIPVVTDSDTLDTLLAAAMAAGGKVKVRSDHDDALSARAGFADNFRRDGDRVACDLHLFDAYKDRAIVLEAAEETPDQIGLSIDFQPDFVIENEEALMRVTELNAVDIVDSGAITPAGLFLKRGVDNKTNTEIRNNISMAAKTEDTPDKIDQCLAAINTLVKAHSDLAAQNAALSDKVDKLTPPPPPANKDAKADDTDEAMKSGLKELNEKFAAQAEVISTMQKERAALGLKSTSDAAKAAAGSAADELEGQSKKTEKPKTFLELVAEKKAEKMGAGDAHRFVMKNHPEAYDAHIKAKGIVK